MVQLKIPEPDYQTDNDSGQYYIYGFHCGTEGVAIPTLVSRFVAAFNIIKLLLKDKWTLHLKRTFRFNPDWSMKEDIHIAWIL